MLSFPDPGKLLLIGAGGFIGACLRYTVSSRVPRIKNIPAGTLTVNLLGTIALALLTFSSEPESVVYFINIGILGSFTTFSTFAYETFKLLEEGQSLSFSINIFLNVVLCFSGVSIAYLALDLWA
ncbi:MAG: fluoride efflux transporter CrcB [Methanosarcina thermophila]|uniref:Fluoride-specific ion channel FluC n=3 Tax=Methanosarcina thermophila TaxID=2210 RepID=A0A1I6XB86_METTE|nr:fluoride efflux transporter CrcB [Methanosarcina thermophila]ALK04547.1 MAG: chromosome condensation protein CrcB [Methanosarcina sp. 795]AKB13207.1 CrcB protein [Methanosarcina thermophila TM-1]AKB16157.1 CrcB protein [Methanosarcina thermophila CHTI-55]NLU57170.1 fluoride efflux transporter CrcB [Methanosarcina thermophila]SFT35393.1 camphor resistance protein CrcB [Methanosarcina thermophila]